MLAMSLILQSCSAQQDKNGYQNSDSPQQTASPVFSDDRISEVVRIIFQDSKGHMWFGTQNGMFKYNGVSLIHIAEIKSEYGKGVTIKDIAESKDGKIWIGHTDGMSCMDGEKVTNYYASDGLINNDVWCIAADAKGDIWIGTIAGVNIFDGHEFRNFELPKGQIDTTLGISSAEMVHNIMEDSKGVMWLSTNAGLFSYSNGRLSHESEELGIQTNFVNEIMEDDKGDFWISTKEALYHLKDDNLENITRDKIEIGKGIGSIAEDKNGNIWFVANQHHLYIYNGEDITEYQKSEDNRGPVIFQILKDDTDRLWFIGYDGAFRMEDGKFLHVTKDGPW